MAKASISLCLGGGNNERAISTKEKIDKLYDKVCEQVPVSKGDMITTLILSSLDNQKEVFNLLVKESMQEEDAELDQIIADSKQRKLELKKQLSKM